MKAIFHKICITIYFNLVVAQFRAGHITWQPLTPGSNTVQFTVKTAWLRSAGTYTPVINGAAVHKSGYQPVQGDVIRILGFETPKFITTDYQEVLFEEYLTANVTSNTESLPNGAGDQGAGKPHSVSDWSYYANNWFEAVSTFEVTYPRRDVTYPAELQGCCRQQSMRRDVLNAAQFRDGTGILELSNTPYTIRVFVRLDRDPPPIPFTPSFLPFSKEGGMSRMDLPIIDFMSTYLAIDPVEAAAQPRPWSDVIVEDAKDAQGYLSMTESRPAVGRRLMQADPAAQAGRTLNNLPVTDTPSPVFATAAGTGDDTRMLPHDPSRNPGLLRLHRQGLCSGPSSAVFVAPGMDVCAGSPVQRYPDGGRVAANFSSVLVPAGLALALTDACEYSAPLDRAGAFAYGAVLAQFDNSAGAGPACWTLPAGRRGRMLRRLLPAGNPSSPRNSIVTYRTLSDGRIQASLNLDNVQDQGNYAVKLRAATNGSSVLEAEFVVHLMLSTGGAAARYLQEELGFPVQAGAAEPMGSNAPKLFPTGFPTALGWQFAPQSFQVGGKTIFDNRGLAAFGPAGPGVAVVAAAGGPRLLLTWTPCPPLAGAYFYCAFAQQQYPPYDYAATKCAYLSVVRDLAPTLRFYDAAAFDLAALGDPAASSPAAFRVHMGETLRVLVRAADNALDTIETFGISQVNTNTGDRLRARIMYRYANLGTPAAPVRGVAPALLEPALPTFLGLAVSAGAPPPQALGVAALDRVLTYVPSRMHSGLEMEACFLAVDARGSCKRHGRGTSRCLSVSVEPCRYSLGPGETLVSVAGLFETNWLQLYALNPTYSSPDVPAANRTVINVGHFYRVQEGNGGGETAEELRQRFGAGPERLALLNVPLAAATAGELARGGRVPAGTVLCLIPESCATNA